MVFSRALTVSEDTGTSLKSAGTADVLSKGLVTSLKISWENALVLLAVFDLGLGLCSWFIYLTIRRMPASTTKARQKLSALV